MTALTALKRFNAWMVPRWVLQLLCSSGAGWGSCCMLNPLESSIGRTQDRSVQDSDSSMRWRHGHHGSKQRRRIFWTRKGSKHPDPPWAMFVGSIAILYDIIWCVSFLINVLLACYCFYLGHAARQSKHLTLFTPEGNLKESKWWQIGMSYFQSYEPIISMPVRARRTKQSMGLGVRNIIGDPFALFDGRSFNMFQWYVSMIFSLWNNVKQCATFKEPLTSEGIGGSSSSPTSVRIHQVDHVDHVDNRSPWVLSKFPTETQQLREDCF